MDAITVKIPQQPSDKDIFTLMTNDYDPDTSASGIADKVGTIAYEVCTRMSTRYSRVYQLKDCKPVIFPALSQGIY